ncbi:hypothetical protein [Nocardioides halotolerans]|uniref:hypothetical protein n=1 Tax=Nocardioides halotolerans TaxID=433660 RepID=UPI0004228251|nr:hypothetical protein [Nocardioides halotolerans]
MPTIDLGPPRPTPHDLLDGLPRRVALTLPELRFAAERANGAPLPFDVRDGGLDGGLDERLGSSRGSDEAAAYAETLARLHDPVTTLSRRGLLVGGPDDGVLEDGLVGAIGLLATPTVALDLDIAAGPVQVKSWHRQHGGAVAALSTQDGLVFELAWFPTWAWAAELARAAVVPEDLPLSDSVVPDRVVVPHDLADAAVEAARTHRTDLVPVLVEQHPGGVTDATGTRLGDGDAVRVLTGLATEARGRLRALVADVSGEETSTVGVVAWTLVADGWRALRAHRVVGDHGDAADETGLLLEVARVIPDDLAAELAPVLAEVAP